MHLIWHTMLTVQFSRQFENKDTPFQVKGVSDLANELCYFFGNAMNKFITNLANWCSETVIF